MTSAEAVITNSMAGMFWGGSPLETRLYLHDRIIASLRNAGIKETEIANVNEMWVKYIGIIYYRSIKTALEEHKRPDNINTKASPELPKALKEFEDMVDFSKLEVPSPDVMQSFINERGIMNDEAKELIEDYRYFIKTNDIRRREVFISL